MVLISTFEMRQQMLLFSDMIVDGNHKLPTLDLPLSFVSLLHHGYQAEVTMSLWIVVCAERLIINIYSLTVLLLGVASGTEFCGV